MKKILFSLILVYSSFAGIAQDNLLRLNEFYVKPTDGETNTEFFEIASSPNNTINVNSDSYVVLTYFNNGAEEGFYLFDLSNRAIAPGGFYLAASRSKPFTYQNTRTFNLPGSSTNVDLNWNATTGSASAHKFVYNGGWTSTALSGAKNGGHDEFTAILLKKVGSTMQAVDGFIASTEENRFEVPEYIASLPTLTFNIAVGATTSSVSVNFGTLQSDLDGQGKELGAVPAADFTTEDGYYLCSSWDRTTSGAAMTPRALNTSIEGLPLQVTTDCLTSNANVYVTVTSGQVSPYPISASLYVDVDHDRVLDISKGDYLKSLISIRTKGKQYAMAKGVGNHDFILVLNASADCYDDIVPFACTDDIVTPVTLTNFSAVRNGSNVQLIWQTATESNNQGFFIQRKSSTDETWDAVTFVSTKVNGGNSNTALSYTFADNNPAQGVTQYRLLQVDNDGKATYSPVRSVKGIEQSSKTIIFPNPSSNGIVNVIFEDASALRNLIVTDMMGRVLQQHKGVSGGSIQISKLIPGVYNLSILNVKTGQQKIERIVISK
jgi:hypothetical protein